MAICRRGHEPEEGDYESGEHRMLGRLRLGPNDAVPEWIRENAKWNVDVVAFTLYFELGSGCRVKALVAALERQLCRIMTHPNLGGYPVWTYALGPTMSVEDKRQGRSPRCLRLALMLSRTAPFDDIIACLHAVAWAVAAPRRPYLLSHDALAEEGCPLLQLPEECLLLIAENLHGESRETFRLVCRAFRALDGGPVPGLPKAPTVLPRVRLSYPEGETVCMKVIQLKTSMAFVRSYMACLWNAARYEDEHWFGWFKGSDCRKGFDAGPVEWSPKLFALAVVWDWDQYVGGSCMEWIDMYYWGPNGRWDFRKGNATALT